MTDTSNRWLVEALQWLIVQANENGCVITGAEMMIRGIKHADCIQLGGSTINVEVDDG